MHVGIHARHTCTRVCMRTQVHRYTCVHTWRCKRVCTGMNASHTRVFVCEGTHGCVRTHNTHVSAHVPGPRLSGLGKNRTCVQRDLRRLTSDVPTTQTLTRSVPGAQQAAPPAHCPPLPVLPPVHTPHSHPTGRSTRPVLRPHQLRRSRWREARAMAHTRLYSSAPSRVLGPLASLAKPHTDLGKQAHGAEDTGGGICPRLRSRT